MVFLLFPLIIITIIVLFYFVFLELESYSAGQYYGGGGFRLSYYSLLKELESVSAKAKI